MADGAPLHSMATSNDETSSGVSEGTQKWAAPRRRASASRDGSRSIAVTTAPARWAAWMALAPIPPMPMTATASSGPTSATLCTTP